MAWPHVASGRFPSRLLEDMPHSHRDTISLLRLLRQDTLGALWAVAVFRCMLAEDVVPNAVTLAGVVTAFVRHGAPTTVAIMAHGVVLRRGWMSLSL